jgi:drug/metabolite transporter (DMT)-like permease
VELKVWSAIVVASIGYGTTGVATRAALNAGVPPIGLAAIRAVLAASVLAAWFLITRRPVSRDRHNLVTGLVSGLFQLSIPFILFTLAYQYASAGFVGLIVALMPLTVASVAHLFLPDEPLTGPKVIGLTVAFAGVGILLFSGDSGLGAGGRPLLAAVLTLGAVISMSFATVFIRSRAGTYDPVELTLLQFLVGVVVVGVAMFAAEGTPEGITAWGWTMILYLTAVGSLLPTVLYFWLLSRVTSTKTALVGYVTPLIALVAGVIFLSEVIQIGIAIGGAFILAGVVLTDRAERKLARSSAG